MIYSICYLPSSFFVAGALSFDTCTHFAIVLRSIFRCPFGCVWFLKSPWLARAPAAPAPEDSSLPKRRSWGKMAAERRVGSKTTGRLAEGIRRRAHAENWPRLRMSKVQDVV